MVLGPLLAQLPSLPVSTLRFLYFLEGALGRSVVKKYHVLSPSSAVAGEYWLVSSYRSAS